MTTIRQRLAGLGATLVLLALVVGAPLILLGIGARPWETSLSELRLLLFSPDDGHLALLVFQVGAWAGWAFTALSVVVEVLARVRGIRAPHLPGFGVPQQAMGRLVTMAALTFTIAPVAAPVIAPVAAHGVTHGVDDQTHGVQDEPHVPAHGVDVATHGVDVATHGVDVATHGVDVATHGVDHAAPDAKVERARDLSVEYTVRQGDSLWRIAEQHLGSGTRFTELVALNDDVLDGRAGFLTPGTVLRLPAEAAASSAAGSPRLEPDTHVVEPGDTLWDIADEHLGDPERYPEIVEASVATLQDDGQHLTDPDLIQPGWRLTIPAQSQGDHEREESASTDPSQDRLHVVPEPVPPPTSAPERRTVPEEVQPTPQDSGEDNNSSATWLVPGLLGAGGLLAGGLLLRVVASKRTQQRHRRPGFVIAPPPAEVRDVEKTITVAAPPAADALTKLDRLLTQLASVATTLPVLDAVELSHGTVTLHLSEPLAPVEPWTGTDTAWRCVLDAEVAEVEEIPPYPLLVSIGQTSDGHVWLLNLERPEGVKLTGDTDRACALARHIAAELVLHPWSFLTWVHLVDTAPELEGIAAGRLVHHPVGDVSFLGLLHQAIGCAGEPEVFGAVLTHQAASSPELDSVTQAVNSAQARTGIAVITVEHAAAADTPGVRLNLTTDGHVHVPHLDLTLAAAGLSKDEAVACAAIVDLSRRATNVPIPVDEEATGVRALADDAGALRTDLTEPRPAEGEAGPQSLLSESSQAYLDAAATTQEDLDTLSPVTPVQTRRQVEDVDPDLDRDVVDWFDHACPVPRLRLMGSVCLRVPGDTPGAVERPALLTEIAAYLALHPSGLSGQCLSDIFEVAAGRMRSDVGDLRTWLGTNPRTGRPYVPLANAAGMRDGHPIKGYRIEGVLVDHDLFIRLRTRGQARGADGIDDLITALSLVAGRPFGNLRDNGWHWLLDDERTQDITLVAVVDVAHLVTTHALERGDLDLAHRVSEKACTIAPEFDSCQLDLVRVLETQGRQIEADTLMKQRIHNRSDDGRGPIDLPPRSATVSRRRA